MAVVNILSPTITNLQATPIQHANSYINHSDPFEAVEVAAVGSSDSATSTYRFNRVSSSARVSDVQVMNDALTSGTSYKCGFLETAANGGGLAAGVAGADAVLFAAGTSMVSARNTWTPLAFHGIAGSGGAVANVKLRVWEMLGLTADPFRDYEVAITAVTPSSVAGNIALRFQASI